MNKIKEEVFKELGYDDLGDVLKDTDEAIDLTIQKTTKEILKDIEECERPTKKFLQSENVEYSPHYDKAKAELRILKDLKNKLELKYCKSSPKDEVT